MRPYMKRVLDWLWRHRWVIGITLLALAVHMAWVHWIHPPQKYLFSDMKAYFARAERLVRSPFGKFADEPFFPFGTHYLLAIPLALFGNKVACASWWALLATPLSPIAYYLAGRLHGGAGWSAAEHGASPPLPPEESGTEPSEARISYERHAMARTIARAAGLFIAVYYPLLSYTGYFLSELPFALTVSASALFGLRLADHGKTSDAVWLGIVTAIGAAIRPQILVGFGMFTLLMIARRSSFPGLRLWKLAVSFLPIAAVVGFSLVHSHHHTGRATVLAQNGALNRAFGRCHAMEIRAKGATFGPPPLGQLVRNEQKDPNTWLKLRPARGTHLRVKGRVWDEQVFHKLADDCAKQTGLLRQGYYAMSHVVLLWGYHVAWPDMGQNLWRPYMRGWTHAHLVVFLLPTLIAMAMGANRRWPRHGLLGVHMWGLFLTAALIFGSARFRVPYDVISIVLGLDIYARVATWAAQRWRAHRASREA